MTRLRDGSNVVQLADYRKPTRPVPASQPHALPEAGYARLVAIIDQAAVNRARRRAQEQGNGASLADQVARVAAYWNGPGPHRGPPGR